MTTTSTKAPESLLQGIRQGNRFLLTSQGTTGRTQR